MGITKLELGNEKSLLKRLSEIIESAK